MVQTMVRTDTLEYVCTYTPAQMVDNENQYGNVCAPWATAAAPTLCLSPCGASGKAVPGPSPTLAPPLPTGVRSRQRPAGRNTVKLYRKSPLICPTTAALAAVVGIVVTCLASFTPWPSWLGEGLGLLRWQTEMRRSRPSGEGQWGYFGSIGTTTISPGCDYTHTLNRTSICSLVTSQTFVGMPSPLQYRELVQRYRDRCLSLWPANLDPHTFDIINDALSDRLEADGGLPAPLWVVYVDVGWPFRAFRYCRVYRYDELPNHYVDFYHDEGWFPTYESEARYPVRPIAKGLLVNALFFGCAAYFPLLGLVAAFRAANLRLSRVRHRLLERRAGSPLCRECGYRLPGVGARCPECGHTRGQTDNEAR